MSRPTLARLFALLLPILPATTACAQEPSIQATWVFAADGVRPGSTLHAAVQFKLSNNFHVQSNKPLDEFLIPTKLTLTPPPGIVIREIVYPKPVKFSIAGDAADVFEQQFAIGVAFEVAADVKPGEYPIAGALGYQACNDKICLQPTSLAVKTRINVVSAETPIVPTDNPIIKGIRFSSQPPPITNPTPPRNGAPTPPDTGPAPNLGPGCDVVKELEGFTILGSTGGYLGVDEFLDFVNHAESGTLQRSIFENKGPLVIVLLVILGGLLLNLTPCVLPLVPINLAIIGAGTQAGSRARGFALGGAYGLAMAIVYGALGLIVTLTSTAFGAINSTIWFNVAIAILFIALALAMFDVIAIDFTKYQSRFDANSMGKRGTMALAFGMGAVTALLAGACVAPVVIQVIVYSGDQYARGTTIALALPFFLGLGMALPWPFAGAGLALLPKPGKWMTWVKKGMGVFILTFAAYYGYLAYEIWDSTRVDRAAVQSAVNERLEGGWTASICDGLARARAENKPVLIDMWATWCKNCLAMDKTTFKDEQVTARLQDYVKIKYQAEDLGATPTREMLKSFEGIGLPTYAILRPRPASATTLDPTR